MNTPLRSPPQIFGPPLSYFAFFMAKSLPRIPPFKKLKHVLSASSQKERRCDRQDARVYNYIPSSSDSSSDNKAVIGLKC